MSKKTVLITGASSGFGMLAAHGLAKAGYHVIATMRNLEKKAGLMKSIQDDALDENVTLLELDVTSSDSIQALKHFLNETSKIDILINNAGYAFGGFGEEITADEYREQFETNFFGVIAVTQAVLPFMRSQRSGKIINMSSISGLIGFPGLSPYVSSKHALEGFSESLRLEVKPFGIDVILVEPGSFSTNIWTTGKRVSPVSMEASSPYYEYMIGIEDELERGREKLGNPGEVAALIVKLCKKKTGVKLRYTVGKGVRFSLFLKRILPWSMWESIIIGKLLPSKK
ncbi:oxidoreductase [Metabacillus hrfriensis]|uniref:Oxidoreductase n=1 Tax=Metabacillus hrfriensis TaxID=3048891 RepID=A0ACD4RA26_9BACI|nr:oxidoreductase [Metabacillus sp. CT-WN-B3]USK28105.1 oxidoreductase [Bacillus sp. CMF21]WHZ57311.1 oxidoreductase [Metabacillus sp. CT-WN-B3]